MTPPMNVAVRLDIELQELRLAVMKYVETIDLKALVEAGVQEALSPEKVQATVTNRVSQVVHQEVGRQAERIAKEILADLPEFKKAVAAGVEHVVAHWAAQKLDRL